MTSFDIGSELTVTVHPDGRVTWDPKRDSVDDVVRAIDARRLAHVRQARQLEDLLIAIHTRKVTP